MNERILVEKKINPDEMFWLEFSVEPCNPREAEKISKKINKEFFPIFLEKIKKEIPDALTYSNFYGSAEEYMYRNNVPFTKLARKQYAQAIYQDFIKNLDNVVIYDEESGLICISPYILALEKGDFYIPGIQFVSKAINEFFEQIQKS